MTAVKDTEVRLLVWNLLKPKDASTRVTLAQTMGAEYTSRRKGGAQGEHDLRVTGKGNANGMGALCTEAVVCWECWMKTHLSRCPVLVGVELMGAEREVLNDILCERLG